MEIKNKPLETIPQEYKMFKKIPKELATVTVPIKPGVEVPITDLLEMVEFVAVIANVVGGFILTGGNIIGGIISFVPVVPKAIKAISGFSRIPDEIKFMTSKQKDRLISALKDKLTFSDRVEEIIGVSLDIAFGIKRLISVFKYKSI